MNKKTFPRDVAHNLSDDDVLATYDKAQEIDEQADELLEQLKDQTKDRKEEIRKLRAEAKRRRHAAAERSEMRSVQCYEELRGSQVFVIRLDTGDEIDQRAATEEDQQQTFPGLAADGDGLPLDPDYTPSADAPKAPTEKRPRKGGKGKKAR